MNGLALDITVLAFLVLFLSAGLLLFGFMWEQRNCTCRYHVAARSNQGALNRVLWNDKAWQRGVDPRTLLKTGE